MNISSFKLSKKYADSIEKLIQAKLFNDAKSNPIPRITILGGQPGSGKSKLIETVQNRFDSMPVIINGDELRKFHPLMSK